jgi:hypothetical protein
MPWEENSSVQIEAATTNGKVSNSHFWSIHVLTGTITQNFKTNTRK